MQGRRPEPNTCLYLSLLILHSPASQQGARTLHSRSAALCYRGLGVCSPGPALPGADCSAAAVAGRADAGLCAALSQRCA